MSVLVGLKERTPGHHDDEPFRCLDCRRPFWIVVMGSEPIEADEADDRPIEQEPAVYGSLTSIYVACPWCGSRMGMRPR